MALTPIQNVFAKMDAHATRLIPSMTGNDMVTDRSIAIPYRQALDTRQLVQHLDAIGITPQNAPDLVGKAGTVLSFTYRAMASSAGDMPGELVMRFLGEADHLNQRLRADAGDKADDVAIALYKTIEGSWPHAQIPMMHTQLCHLLGVDPEKAPAPQPDMFSRPAVELERRMNAQAMLQQGLFAFHRLEENNDTDQFKAYMAASAQSFLANSIYEMAGAHNRDMALDGGAMPLLNETYAHSLALARFLAMHPAEQMTLMYMNVAISDSAARTGKLLPMMLGPIDNAFFANAFFERACAAIDADDTQAALLRAHINNAMGIKSDDPAPKPDRKLGKRRDLN